MFRSKLQKTLEWMIIAIVVVGFFYWAGTSKPVHAQEYDGGYDEGYLRDGDPEFWSDIGNQPQMIIYRDRGTGRNRRQEPEYWSDIRNPPQMTIYPGRRR